MLNTLNTTPANSEEWFELAKSFIDTGWSVIPVGKDKKPLVGWKKYQSQFATSVELRTWSKNSELKGFAVVTGKLSNLIVIDIDRGSAFDTSNLPKTIASKTGSGGFHYFFKYPKNTELRNLTGFEEKTDFRGEGGYAILPPSIHSTGKRYEWINSLEESSLANVPNNLLLKIKRTVKSEKDVTKKSEDLSKLFSGVDKSKRNDSAAKVIGSMISSMGISKWESQAWPLTIAWNKQNKPPLEINELRTVFDSICKIDREKNPTKKSGSSGSQAQKIIEIFTQSSGILFHNQFNEACLTEPECPFLTHTLTSKYSSMLLGKMYWDEVKRPASPESIKSAIHTLGALAVFNGKQESVYNRIARFNDFLYYNIGDKKHVIEIRPDGWNLVGDCPVKFRHYSHQKAQVLPVQNGEIRAFDKYLNIKNKQHKLLIYTYLCSAFIPDIPRSMLILNGDQGSSKSTLLKMLRSLIDPSQIPLLSPPESLPQLIQNASHHYAFFLDNLSSINGWLSDSLCRLITGDSFSKRQLFTDDEDILYQFQRVAGLTGINQVATRADLLDRSIIVSLERIPDHKRQEEKKLWKEFEELKPSILGAIFDIVVVCLRDSSQLEIASKPRMADYFKNCVIAAKCMGYEEADVVEIFSSNAKQQNLEAIESSPVAQTLVEFMKNHSSWEDSSTNLFQELEPIADNLKLKRGFPKSPSWLWRRIKEVRPNLMAHGIEISRNRGGKSNLIRIEKNVSDASTDSTHQANDQPQENVNSVSTGSMLGKEELDRLSPLL